MEEDIKPDATDSDFEESSELDEAISDLFEEGETDAVETAENPVITLSRLEELSGRKFSSVEEAEKHYTNLKNFVGKKQETVVKPQVKDEVDIEAKLAKMLDQRLEERELTSRPESKDYVDIVKAVAKDKGISLTEAWDKHVKDMATAAGEYKKGRDVGVNSTTRINPQVSKQKEATVQSARQGNPDAQDALVADHLKAIGL